MSTFDFDHELIFSTTFDVSIISKSEIAERDDSQFIQLVQDEFNKIMNILTLYQGIPAMSSQVKYNTLVFKITVRK